MPIFMKSIVRSLTRKGVKLFIKKIKFIAPVAGSIVLLYLLSYLLSQTNNLSLGTSTCPTEPVVCRYFQAVNAYDSKAVLETIARQYADNPLFQSYITEGLARAKQEKVSPVIPTYVGQYYQYVFVGIDVEGNQAWMVFTIDQEEHKIARID